MYVCSIMAMHPVDMGRYYAPLYTLLFTTLSPIQKPTMRPAYPLSNAMLNIGN